MACWKKQKLSKEDVDVVLLKYKIDIYRNRAGREARITELEKQLKELNDERNLMKDMLRGLIMEQKREEEEDGTVMCDHCIIQHVELALSQCTVSRNAHCSLETSRTSVTCDTTDFNEALNFILKRSNNAGFWKKFKFWKKRGESTWDKLVAADLKYIEKVNGLNAEMDARITELQKTLKEINDWFKLVQDQLRCQIKELEQEARSWNYDVCCLLY
jgi:hypothetical protein